MSDAGENELTSEDKRILKYVADAAREEMPSRRGFIQGTTAAAAIGALGFGTGQATAQTQPAAGQVGTENNPVDVEAATVNAGDAFSDQADVTIHVPTDFDTVHQAIAENHRLVSSELSIEIVIESGHAIQQTIEINGGDYSHIEVSSEDDTVPVSSSLPSGDNVIHCLGAAQAPTLNLLIDCQGNGDNGMLVEEGSVATTKPGEACGIINASNTNLAVSHAARFYGYGDDFTGAGNNGITVRATSMADFGGTPRGPDVSDSGNFGLEISNSLVRAESSVADDCGSESVRVIDGFLKADTLTSANSGGFAAVYATNSRVQLSGGTLNGASDGTLGIASGKCSQVVATTVDISNHAGITANHASKITARAGEISGTITVGTGSFIQCSGTTTDSSTGSDPHENDLSIAPNTLTSDGIIFADSTES